MSERHLNTLLSDTTAALDLLASLSQSFKAVELETTAFQAQCEDLLAEQQRLRTLADEVGTDLQYYAYLEPLTRRLNAPGAARVIRSNDFLDMLRNLVTCIDFMDQHVSFVNWKPRARKIKLMEWAHLQDHNMLTGRYSLNTEIQQFTRHGISLCLNGLSILFKRRSLQR